jgi:hypothetical protein
VESIVKEVHSNFGGGWGLGQFSFKTKFYFFFFFFERHFTLIYIMNWCYK